MPDPILWGLGTGAVLSAFGAFATMQIFRRFYVAVEPDEYVVHYRRGQVQNLGRGLSFLCLPYDTYLKVPSTIRDINFCADQITKEKQGVRVQGFLAYKIENFELAYQSLDLKAKAMKILPQCAENIEETSYDKKTKEKIIPLDPGDPMAKTDLVLRRLAESVVRHEVSNKTVEAMISERETVIQSMREQLQKTVGDWGITIDTIEFTEVWVRSKELFQSLQAEYRNEMRRQAAISDAETNRSIAEKRLETERKIASLAAENDRLKRLKESQEQKLAEQAEISDRSEVESLKVESERERERQRLEAERNLDELRRRQEFEARAAQIEHSKQEELLKIETQLAEAAEVHRLELDRRTKAKELKERALETARLMQEKSKQVELEALELERKKQEALEISQRQATQAELARETLQAEARAQVLRLEATARKEASLEEAQALVEMGQAKAKSLQARIEAENLVQPSQIQKRLVEELPRIAESMRIDNVRWVNFAGSDPQNSSPLGLVPGAIAQMMTTFQELGGLPSGAASPEVPQDKS